MNDASERIIMLWVAAVIGTGLAALLLAADVVKDNPAALALGWVLAIAAGITGPMAMISTAVKLGITAARPQ